MIKGICINKGQSTSLEKGKSYFLFPAGTKHFFVSRFPNINAHTGCFSAEYFQLEEKEEWPQEPETTYVQLDPEKIYKAKLIWRKLGYKSAQLGDYFIKPKGNHCHFYKDSDLSNFGGCFPQHWFTDFEEVVIKFEDAVTENKVSEPNFEEIEQKPMFLEQLSLFE